MQGLRYLPYVFVVILVIPYIFQGYQKSIFIPELS